MTKEDIRRRLLQQLAWELNCAPEDFSADGAVLTSPVLHEKRRRFSDRPYFLQMATFGAGAVISADERLHPWLRAWAEGERGFWLFEQHHFFALELKLREYGYRMSQTHHMFLPKPELLDRKTDLSLRWLEQEDLRPFYGREELSNALCDRFRPERPDMLAVAAMDGERLMGMAGCSADTPELWQIGIDVLPPYRGRGVGRTLVGLLRDEALRRGALPYYGTSLSNIASWRIALETGFLPAWVEAEAREAEDGAFAK